MAISIFIFRDFIQYILPTIIAICLFAPFGKTVVGNITLEGIIVSSALIGYLASSLMSAMIAWAYTHLPVIKKYELENEQILNFMNKNWDYNKLFYAIAKDDREYLYTTNAYMDFYKSVSFYFLVFFLVNLVYLIKSIVTHFTVLLHTDSLMAFYLQIQDITTPLLGGLKIPTYLVLFISFMIFYYTFKDYLTEYEILFYPDGQYDNFAKIYHQEKKSIAKSLWGKLSMDTNTESIHDIEIELFTLHSNGLRKSLGKAETYCKGYFQFADKYAECCGVICSIAVKSGAKKEEKIFILKDQQVPYFEFR